MGTNIPGVSITAIQASLIASAVNATDKTRGKPQKETFYEKGASPANRKTASDTTICVDMIDKDEDVKCDTTDANLDNEGTPVVEGNGENKTRQMQISTRHTFAPYISAQER